ncbi:cysteine desulfurase [Candidatus Woesearchaeota archaeon]|nr:MAG: cysteine desulfurase [Candidatus Woesearchaeota archaeon]
MRKSDFPLLRSGNIVYLDSAATTQKPDAVLNAHREFLEKHNANVHRGVYSLSEDATGRYESARKRVADFINASAQEVVFTRNATESINVIARSWGEANVSEGDTILLTEMEHHSNLVPWQMLAKRKGAKLKFVPITEKGELDMEKARDLLSERPKLFALTHVSNVLGTVNPIVELTRLAHEGGVAVLIDAAQSVAHMRVDVRDIDCEFLVFSGHKLYAPALGVLYAKKHILEEMEPVLGGGEMIKEVSFTSARWNDIPHKFEAGTPDAASAIALAAAVDYIEKIGFSNIQAHEKELVDYAYRKLSEIPCVRIYGPKERAAVVSFNLGDMHSHDVSSVLDDFGVCVRSGQHCAQPLLEKLGIPACARISFGIYNDKSDVDSFIKALLRAKEVFGL